MNAVDQDHVELLRLAARKLTGHRRRAFVADVTLRLGDGNARQAEERWGWGRETVRKGLQELRSGTPAVDTFQARGRTRLEELHPGFADDLRDLVEPKTQTDPELKTDRRYTNLSAAEIRRALIDEKGWSDEDLPAERSLRRILKRMTYRLKRIQKGRPLKKTQETDALFENVQAVKAASRDDPQTLELSGDTKAKVAIGNDSRGGKNTDRFRRSSGAGVGP